MRIVFILTTWKYVKIKSMYRLIFFFLEIYHTLITSKSAIYYTRGLHRRIDIIL